jgi:DNA-binding response OmpR family regulator
MEEQKHILIVDDDIELGALLAKAVADMSPSYTVKLARDVDEAMVQVRRSQTTENMFDLVITDIKMTGLNGLELLEALHALVPELKTIAMTAYTSSEIAGRANELGVQAYLTKPFMISEFRSVVRTTLDTPLMRRQLASQRTDSGGHAHPQHEQISRALSSLRSMTAADAAFLLRNDGTLIATDTREPDRDVTELGAALQAAQQAITDRMTHLFDSSCAVRQSFYGTDAYSVCTYRVDSAYTAAVVFGPEVREGQVWYYMRDAASTLSTVLGAETLRPFARRRGGGGDVRDLLDRFLPEGQRPSVEAGTSAETTQRHGRGAAQTSSADAGPRPAELGADAQEPYGDELSDARESDQVPEHAARAEYPEPEALDPSIADDIDWDAIDEMSWDSILEETDPGWEGISLEEARRRGLVDDLNG